MKRQVELVDGPLDGKTAMVNPWDTTIRIGSDLYVRLSRDKFVYAWPTEEEPVTA